MRMQGTSPLPCWVASIAALVGRRSGSFDSLRVADAWAKCSIPWPELRRIVWQRLSQVVERLSQAGARGSPGSSSGSAAAAETRKRARAEGDDDAKDEAPTESADVRIPDVGQPSLPAAAATSDGDGEGATSNQEPGAEQAEQAKQAEPAEEERAGERAGTAATEETQAPAESGDAQVAAPAAQQANGNGSTEARQIRELEDRISYTLHAFEEAPFTIQRIAELLAWPERHYRSALKFLRAVERVVYVTSTVEEFPTTAPAGGEGDPADAIEQEVAAPSAPAPLASFLAPADPTAPMPGDESIAVRPMSPGGGGGSSSSQPVAERRAWPLPTAAAPTAMPIGIPPLDASDTGILHIRRTAAEDKDDLRTKIQSSVDVSVPVCIDEPDGTNGKVTVVPVHPAGPSSPSMPSRDTR
ncbi:hypothetical protein H4R21_003062 [Coemansia helicoidea]|uniref:Uncharacterized protein n=1 Tax=Coemansia helicoidea TaxID=1286919 RepID=A0ACC1L3L8_9FUNG|nr:hypothetical protein H4R21_003062 [Coemansia helicoidea]